MLHPDAVHSLAFSPEGRLLLTGCVDVQARFFAVSSGIQVGKGLGHNGTVTSVAYSPDGKTAFTSTAGGGEYQPARTVGRSHRASVSATYCYNRAR